MTERTRTSKALDAGCAILHERIAEAFEPEWRELLSRIYEAMRRALGEKGGGNG